MTEDDEKSKRIFFGIKGQSVQPYRITIHLTDRCNLDCGFCNGWNAFKSGVAKNKKEMTTEDWTRITKEGLMMGIKEWEIGGGGEPLMHENGRTVTEILRTIKSSQKDSYVELLTNGTLFSSQMIREFVELGIDKIFFGIDGPDAETHDFIRGGRGSFKKVISALSLFSEFEKAKKTNKPEITIQTVLCNANYDKLSEIVSLIHSFKVSNFIINNLIEGEYTANKIEKLKINEEQFRFVKSNIDKLEHQAVSYGFKEFFWDSDEFKIPSRPSISEPIENATIKENPDDRFSSLMCFKPWYNIYVNPYGEIKFCHCFIGESLQKFKTLNEAWESEYFNDVRKLLLESRLTDFCVRPGDRCKLTTNIRDGLSNFIKKS